MQPPRIDQVQREGDLVKFSLRLADGATVESVVIPMTTRGALKNRLTLCLSTQVGCRMGCVFCATGDMGFVRDLAPEEIVAQTTAAEQLVRRPDTLVFMGMGEPLDNPDGVLEAIRLLCTSRRVGTRPPLGWSTGAMTLSTVGHVKGLRAIADRFWRKMTLAVSINAPTDEIRSRLMPVNRRWPMAELRETLLSFPMRHKRFLAEYVVVRGLNDLPEHAEILAQYLRPFRAFVNLIALNPTPATQRLGLVAPTDEDVVRFRKLCSAAGLPAYRRESKGQSIAAACGQLASSTRT